MNHTDTDLPETTPEEIDEFSPENLDIRLIKFGPKKWELYKILWELCKNIWKNLRKSV